MPKEDVYKEVANMLLKSSRLIDDTYYDLGFRYKIASLKVAEYLARCESSIRAILDWHMRYIEDKFFRGKSDKLAIDMLPIVYISMADDFVEVHHMEHVVPIFDLDEIHVYPNLYILPELRHVDLFRPPKVTLFSTSNIEYFIEMGELTERFNPLLTVIYCIIKMMDVFPELRKQFEDMEEFKKVMSIFNEVRYFTIKTNRRRMCELLGIDPNLPESELKVKMGMLDAFKLRDAMFDATRNVTFKSDKILSYVSGIPVVLPSCPLSEFKSCYYLGLTINGIDVFIDYLGVKDNKAEHFDITAIKAKEVPLYDLVKMVDVVTSAYTYIGSLTSRIMEKLRV